MFNDEIIRLDQIRTVSQYPYRRARVVGIFIKLNRSDDKIRDFELALAKRANATTDNHTVYELTNYEGEKLYIFASDSYLGIGTHIVVEDW